MKNFYLSLSAIIVLTLMLCEVNAQSTFIYKPQGASTSMKVKSNYTISTCTGSVATTFPSTTDTILFSNCSSTNATLDTNINVAYINIKSNYTGTITQSSDKTITTKKFRCTGGTFSGGNSAIDISVSLLIDGGTFTSTSGTMTVAGNFSKSSGTFNHNNGKIIFKKGSSGQPSITSTSKTAVVDFYDVVFDAPDATTSFSITNIKLTVNNSAEITGSNQLFLNGDTILMSGSSTLTLSSTSNTGGGTAKIKFSGSSTQSLSGNTGSESTKLPNLIIAKSGTLNLSGNISMGGSSYLHYKSGTISEGTSTFTFFYNDSLKGKMTFYNLEFEGHSSSFWVTDTLTVSNNLTASGTAYNQINGGVLKVKNNLVYDNSHGSSIINSTIHFTNNASDQTITGTSGATIYNLIINKPNRNLTLAKPLTVTHLLGMVAGYLITDTTNLLTCSSSCTTSGASASSFVKGPMKKIGNSAFDFPIGKSTTYKPLSITAPSTSTDAFTAEYFNTEQTLGDPKDSLTYLSQCEYWNLDRTIGSSNVKVTLSWDTFSCDIYTLTTLKIARWDGSKWSNTGMVTTTGNTSNGTVQSNAALSAFDKFLIGKKSPAVFAHAGSDATICNGTSATIGGSPSATGGLTPYTYSWSNASLLNSSSIANPVASPLDTTEFVLTVTDLDRSVAHDTVLINVLPKPNADAGSDTIVCKDFEFHIGSSPTASGGTTPYNYLWKNNLGDTLFEVSNPFVEADTSFITYLIVTDSNGCVDRDTLSVTVPMPIEISLHLDTTLYLNESVQLNPVVSGGVGSLNYLWRPSIWLSDSTVSEPVSAPLSTVHYEFIVSDSVGCSIHSFTTISFEPINLGYLSIYAAIALDSIITGDSTIAVGNIASKYVDTSHLRIYYGNIYHDSTELINLKNQIESLIDEISNYSAESLLPFLSNDTLTSGIYRIDSSLNINENLALTGNDSSYFIIYVDGDLIINDSAKIELLNNIGIDRLYFAVEGKILVGNNVLLNGTYLSTENIEVGSAIGSAALFSSSVLKVNSFLDKLEISGPGYICDNVIVFDRGTNPPGTKFKPLGQFYTLVFDDEFETGIFDNIHWELLPSDDNGGGSYINPYGQPAANLFDIAGNIDFQVIKPPQKYVAPDGSEWKYVSTALQTTGNFHYGRFEIGCYQPQGKGIWNAFWEYRSACLSYEEIDNFDAGCEKTCLPIAEIYPDPSALDPCLGLSRKSYHNFICPVDDVGSRINLSSAYHTYGMEWDELDVKFFIDNQLIESYPNVLSGLAMPIIIGSGTTGGPDGGYALNEVDAYTPFPNKFKVDYIKVWKRNSHVFDFYFLDNNGAAYMPTEICPGKCYNLESNFIPGATYTWTNGGGITFKQFPYACNEPWNYDNSTGFVSGNACSFYASAVGAYTITLTASLPQIGNQLPPLLKYIL